MCRDSYTCAAFLTPPGTLITASAWRHVSSSRFVFFISVTGRGISIQPQIPIRFPPLPAEHALSWPHPSQSRVIRHLPTYPDFITSPVLKSSIDFFLVFLLHYSFQFLILGNLPLLLPLGKAWTALTHFKITLSSFGWDFCQLIILPSSCVIFRYASAQSSEPQAHSSPSKSVCWAPEQTSEQIWIFAHRKYCIVKG